MFGSSPRFWVGDSNGAIFGSIKYMYKMAAHGHLGYAGHNFAPGLPIDEIFGSRLGFPAELRFPPQGP